MGNYDINIKKLDTLCDLLDANGVNGNVIYYLGDNFSREPYAAIWKGNYRDGMDLADYEIPFKVYWFPMKEKYCLMVFDYEYDKIVRLYFQPYMGMSGHYLFSMPEKIVELIKMLFSNLEKSTFDDKVKFLNKENNMNKDQKREEAICNLIKELTSKKIYWTSMGVVRGYPTLRIYDKHGQERIADIYVMGTNSDDAYVYAIEPLTFKFREQLKNNKYKCVYTEPRTDNWYVYLRPSTAACVIKDYLTAHAVSESKGYGYDNRDRIKDVIFNDPATIVIWADGSKTVVKANGERFDPEKGLAMAICRNAFGNKHDYYDVFKKYVGRYEKKQKKG